MYYLLGFLVVVILVGTLLLRFTVLMMGQRAGKFISETHHNIEFINNTRSVPPQWLQPFIEKNEQLRHQACQDSQPLEKLTRRAQKTCLKKLNKLLLYVDRSSLVEDEQTRMMLLKKLTTVRREWIEKDWSDIITTDSTYSSSRPC